MGLHIDGQEFRIANNVEGLFIKSDVTSAYAHSDIKFKKKGSELKGILYAKKYKLEEESAMLAKKMAILKEDLAERKDGTKEGHIDNIEEMITRPLTTESVNDITEEQKNTINAYRECFYKCKSCKDDLKTVETLVKHLDDNATYVLNMRQMESIEKGLTEDDLMKGLPCDNFEIEDKEDIEKSEAFDVLIKGDVKGHYRTTSTGKKVFVKQHSDKRTKKEKTTQAVQNAHKNKEAKKEETHNDKNYVSVSEHKDLLDKLITDIKNPKSKTSDQSYKEAKTMVGDLNRLAPIAGKEYGDKVTEALEERDSPSKKTSNKTSSKEDYPVYHNSYGAAINAVETYAKKRGYELNQNEYGNAYTDGFFKPKEGKTKKDSIAITKNGKEQKENMQVQIYGRGNGKYELNMYIN